MAQKISSQHSLKHNIIEKDSSRILIAVGMAVFVSVFSIFATRALISQSLYNQRVISKKEEARNALIANKANAQLLAESYALFQNEAVNIVGGNPSGTGPRDGDNAKIVLDALPSVYDFPALSSSIEKILLDGGYEIDSIGGAEDANLNTDAASESVLSAKPTPVSIPYPFSFQSRPEAAFTLLRTLESSIRPFSVNALKISGQGENINVQVDVSTYFQPLTGLIITKETVQ